MGEEKRPREDGPDGGTGTVLERKPRTKRPRMYRVLLHNDDYTTMEFVVWVLTQVFHKSEAEATHLMLTIHSKGMGVAGVYTRDIAETKVAQVLSLAEEHGMPLICTSEPDD
ncbi:MAG: ATP-dependent Clp protease adapter ClpS [Myxococcota bacterium]